MTKYAVNLIISGYPVRLWVQAETPEEGLKLVRSAVEKRKIYQLMDDISGIYAIINTEKIDAIVLDTNIPVIEKD